jgi:hypothetical protein
MPMLDNHCKHPPYKRWPDYKQAPEFALSDNVLSVAHFVYLLWDNIVSSNVCYIFRFPQEALNK